MAPITSFQESVALFAIFGFIGWLIEVVWRSMDRKRLVNAGFLNGPILPIYGFGALAVIGLDNLLGNSHFIIKSIAFCVTLTIIEYATDYIFDRIFQLRLWDYSDCRLNIQGRVCLMYSLLWTVLAQIFTNALYPPVVIAVRVYTVNWIHIAVPVFIAAIAIDFAFSISALAEFRDAIKKAETQGRFLFRRLREAFPYLEALASSDVNSRLHVRVAAITEYFHSRMAFESHDCPCLEEEYNEIVKDILLDGDVQRLTEFRHHKSSILDHAQLVSKLSYRVCKKLGFDYHSAARGGLLHDFFLYDWRDHDVPDLPRDKNHGFAHPKIALKNAKARFILNNIEQDIILKHMWPLTGRPPRYKESYVVSFVDKYVAAREYLEVACRPMARTVKVFANSKPTCRPVATTSTRDRGNNYRDNLRLLAPNRRPRVKLITIPWSLDVPTLTLPALAAVTPGQMEVAIVDVMRELLFLDEPVDLVAITASTPRIKAAYALADYYRARGSTVVIGGHHATAMPEEAIVHADAVVCGEGETSWQRICDEYLTAPSKVGGIYRDPPPDLANLPLPRTDLLKLNRYNPFAYPVTASRGCPSGCSFCFSKRISPTFRTFPVDHVLEQFRRRPSFVRAVYFVDDNLTADVDYARELFSALKRERIPFAMQSRIELADDEETLRLAHDAGCCVISSGYESINQMNLNGTAKRADARAYRDASARIFDAGIVPSSNWMFGFDWDTPECFEETLAFLDSTCLLDAAFTAEIPFPGTETFARYELQGRILSHDYDDYVGKDHVVFRPKNMNPEQLRDGIRWLAKNFYSVRRLRRRAELASSNPLLLDAFGGHSRIRMARLLGFMQMVHWHTLMSPSLQGVTSRMAKTRKYRYVGEVLRRSNFMAS